jgi:hypothetical protein
MACQIQKINYLFASVFCLFVVSTLGCENVNDESKSNDRSKSKGATDSESEAEGNDVDDKSTDETKVDPEKDLSTMKTNLSIKEVVPGDIGISIIDKSIKLEMSSTRSPAVRYGQFTFTNSKTKLVRCAKLAVGTSPENFSELTMGESPIISVPLANKIVRERGKVKLATLTIANAAGKVCEEGHQITDEEKLTYIEWDAYEGNVSFLGFSKNEDGLKTAVLRYSGVKLRSEDNDLSGANDGAVDEEKIFVGELEVSGTLVVEAEVRKPIHSDAPDSDPEPL